jgi:hypothetical protein
VALNNPRLDSHRGLTRDALKKQIESDAYPGIVRTTLDGVNQREFLEGKSRSARDYIFHYSGKDPSGGPV